MMVADVTVQVNGISLHVRDWAGDAPPMLFLHANRMNAHIWDFVIPALDLPHRKIVPDQRGHGYSDHPADTALYTLEHYISDAMALLDYFAIAETILIGAATGGNIALLMASRYPARFTRLVVINPALSITPEQAREVQNHFREGYTFPDFETALRNLRFSQAWPQANRRAYAEHMYKRLDDGRVSYRCIEDGVAATYGYLSEPIWDEIRVTCPTLLLRGPGSAVYSEADEERLARIIPGAQKTAIPNTGQLLPQDDPQAFAMHIRRFLSDHGGE